MFYVLVRELPIYATGSGMHEKLVVQVIRRLLGGLCAIAAYRAGFQGSFSVPHHRQVSRYFVVGIWHARGRLCVCVCVLLDHREKSATVVVT